MGYASQQKAVPYNICRGKGVIMTTNLTNTTITSKSVDRKYSGLGLHNKIYRAFNAYLYATNFVIKRVDISYNRMTKQYEYNKYFTTVNDNPVVRDLGLSDIRKSNFLILDVDDDNSKKARRINIDGQKYVLSLNILAIQCEDKKMINKLADEGFELDGEKYVSYTASPSNEKHAVKYFVRLTEEIPDEEAAFWRLDKLTGGCISDTLMTKLVSGKQIAKINTRIGNYVSGMKPIGAIDLTKERVAVVKGKGAMGQSYDFDEATRKLMDEQGIEIDNHINDGAGYLSAEKQAVMLNSTLHLNLTVEQSMKVALQTRWTGFTSKIMSRALKSSTLEAMAEFYGAKIYGCENGPLVALIDEDGAKAINWTALESGTATMTIYVLAVANTSGVKSCSQHLIKYMAVNPQKTLELVNKHAMLAMDDFVANRAEAEEGGYSVNSRIMAKLTAEEVFEDSYLVESLYSDAMTYARSMIAENKMPLDGVYTHMMFDLTYALVNGAVDSTLRITEDGFIEAYSRDVLRIYADEIKAIEENDELTEDEKDEQLFDLLSGIVVKFPSAMPKEYEIIVYQTDRQMARKITNLELTNEQKKTIVDYFNNTPYGCTVYAPINAMKNKLAGADVDFDAAMCDMSEFKFILIDQRLKEQETNEGFIGDCTFISYKDIDRKAIYDAKQTKEEEIFTAYDDIDM
jgi:hypothetical protein